jgi:type IV pilus assembly protein PilE
MRLGKSAGFTLIELMVTVAIIGVLAAIAYPSYLGQVRKGKRSEGKTVLLKAAAQQERFFSNNGVYAADLAPLFGMGAGATVYSSSNNAADASSAYVITVALGGVGGNTAFTLTATPNGNFTDAECGNLTLTSTGVRGRSGAGPMSTCW